MSAPVNGLGGMPVIAAKSFNTSAVLNLKSFPPILAHKMCSCAPPATTQSPYEELPSTPHSIGGVASSCPKFFGIGGSSLMSAYAAKCSFTASVRAGSLPRQRSSMIGNPCNTGDHNSRDNEHNHDQSNVVCSDKLKHIICPLAGSVAALPSSR